MKNRIKKLGNYEAIEETNNIIELKKAIKRQVFDANEKTSKFTDGIGMEEIMHGSSVG